jgi:hypothetical protein
MIVALLASGCAGKAPVGDEPAAMGLGVPSDQLARVQVMGELETGQTRELRYANPPRFRVLTYQALQGDTLDVWVRSQGGDAVAWLLDAQGEIAAFNDDANDATTDAHVVTGALATGTYYLVVRDYQLAATTFAITAERNNPMLACQVDADCVRVARDCCHDGWQNAVHAGQEQSYAQALACGARAASCPGYLVLDIRAAVCDAGRGQCAMVDPNGMACGAQLPGAHNCPTGYQCGATGTCQLLDR